MWFAQSSRLSGRVAHIGPPTPTRTPPLRRILIGAFVLLVTLTTSMVRAVIALSTEKRPRRTAPGFVDEVARRNVSDLFSDRVVHGRSALHTQTIRIVDRSGRQVSAEINGLLESGTVAAGDDVELDGHWKQQSFVVKRGVNVATRAPIRIVKA